MLLQIDNSVNIDQLLESYLLGLLTNEDREETEIWFFGDVNRLESLSLAEESLIEKYVTGQLDPDERQQFVSYFLKTEDRVEKLRMYSDLHSYMLTQSTSRKLQEPLVFSPTSALRWDPRTRSAVDSSTISINVEGLGRYLRVFTAMKNFRVLLVRFARWAGWLYFVDQELLDSYERYQDSAKP